MLLKMWRDSTMDLSHYNFLIQISFYSVKAVKFDGSSLLLGDLLQLLGAYRICHSNNDRAADATRV